jgi:hypothetical protein
MFLLLLAWALLPLLSLRKSRAVPVTADATRALQELAAALGLRSQTGHRS